MVVRGKLARKKCWKSDGKLLLWVFIVQTRRGRLKLGVTANMMDAGPEVMSQRGRDGAGRRRGSVGARQLDTGKAVFAAVMMKSIIFRLHGKTRLRSPESILPPHPYPHTCS